MTLVAAADGSALGNPGPAGWAWVVDDQRWAAGGWDHATNNQGELTAVIELLTQASDEPSLKILLDSQYVLKSATVWIPGWKRKGWRKGDGKPVLNVELMQQLDALLEARRAAGHKTEFEWVKGHAGHELNERADKLAQAAARAFQAGNAPDTGPGLEGATPTPEASVTEARAAEGSTPAASQDAPTLFDDALETAELQQQFLPSPDLRLTVWRRADTNEVARFVLEQRLGDGWYEVS